MGSVVSGLTEGGKTFLCGGGVDLFKFSDRGRMFWRTRVGDSGAGGRDGFYIAWYKVRSITRSELGLLT